jgi:hypothetical protein
MRIWITVIGILGLLSYTTLTFAEIYRWVDDEGKVHYSDRKLSANAEDVTKDVSIQNIDTSQDEQRKLQQIFRAENEADREFYRQQQQQNNPSSEQTAYCKKLRNHMREASGRVQLVDENGKVVRFTKKDQQEYIAELQQLEQQHCNNI